MANLQQAWYSGARWPYLLLPLSALYGAIVGIRAWLYRHAWLRQQRVSVPVIIVGNISVGGSGKTPLVAWLVAHLRESGWQPGVVSRGYRGEARQWPQWVTPESNPRLVGDEPVMLAQITQCPVAAAPARIAAANLLIEQGVNIIVADDGLQHYALARDIEIAVQDGTRGYGNGQLLPAGPLRETRRRLDTVDMHIVQGAGQDFWLQTSHVQPLDEALPAQPLATFKGRTVHAVAGIGHPQRFFKSLLAAGITVIAHAFEDHHQYTAEEIQFDDDYPVLMTAKDAVKCREFANKKHAYVVVSAVLSEAAAREIGDLLMRLPSPPNRLAPPADTPLKRY